MSSIPKPKANPVFTLPEAVKLDLADRLTYTRVLPCYQIARAQGCGDGVEPSENVLQKLVQAYAPDVEDHVRRESKSLVEPTIKVLKARLGRILDNLTALGSRESKIASQETGTQFTVMEAVRQVYFHDAKIHADENDGLRHHRRVLHWVRSLRRYVTGFEALGLGVFTATALNINFFDPFDNVSGWLLAVVMVGVMLPLQHFLVKRSGEAFNHYREAAAEGQSFPAESAKRRALWSGVGAGLVGGAVTFALIERFATVTDIGDPFIYWLMIALCTLTGIGMPMFAWIGYAWDGSHVSRERDDLAAALDDSLERRNGLLDFVNLENTAFIDGRIELTDRVIPSILSGAGHHVANARKAYAFLRIQLGGLATKPPYCARNTPIAPADVWSLHTDIPGADPIHVQALEDAAARIASLDSERQQAISAITQLPQHPWARGKAIDSAAG